MPYILCQSSALQIYHEYETAFCRLLQHGETFPVFAFYGDPTCALIAANEAWCLVGGDILGHAQNWLTKFELNSTPIQLILDMEKLQDSKTKKVFNNPRERRYFSESARRLIVEEIDQGLGKAEAARKHNVSLTSLYKWIALYSKSYQKSLKTVVEHQSDSERAKRLESELKEAYENLGRERSKSMYYEELIRIAESELGIDLKKNLDTKHSSICAKQGKKTNSGAK
jgi:transposase